VHIISVSKAVVLDADNSILVLRRSPTHPTMAGQLDLPGGIIDPGEEPGEAVIREIQEETGLSVGFSDLQLVYSGAETYKESYYVRLLYVVKLASRQPTIKLSFEHDLAKWHPLEKLASIEVDYIPYYAHAFDYLIKHQVFESLAN